MSLDLTVHSDGFRLESLDQEYLIEVTKEGDQFLFDFMGDGMEEGVGRLRLSQSDVEALLSNLVSRFSGSCPGLDPNVRED